MRRRRSDQGQADLFGVEGPRADAPRAERMGSVEGALWTLPASEAVWAAASVGWAAGDAHLPALIGIDEAGKGPLAGPVAVAAVALSPRCFEAAGRPAWFDAVDDSKKLTERRRAALFAPILADAAAWAIVHVQPDRIDALNIDRATRVGMAVAVELLTGRRDDALRWPDRPPLEAAFVADDAATPGWYADALTAEAIPTGALALASTRALPFEAPILLIDGDLPLKVSGSAVAAWTQRPIIKGDALSVHIAAASVLAKVSRDAIMEHADGVWPSYGFARHKGYPTAAHRAQIEEVGRCPIHRRSFGS